VMGRVVRAEPDSRPGSRETLHIVGVLPPGFFFGRDSTALVDFLIPEATPIRAYMVRLRPGVERQTAERRITEAARAAATSPIPGDWPGVRLESVYERYVGSLRPVLTGLTVAVTLVLVIACANIAVLMLLRSLRRQKDCAIRLALGASRFALARQVLIESSIITAVALVAGLGVTFLTLAALSPVIEAQLGRPSPGASGIALDRTVLGIVAGISVLIAPAMALAPLTALGRRLMNALRQDGRVSTDGASMRRIRYVLIALEVAGSLVLLIG
jgi:putative ABC transport system permease protein